MAKTKSAIIADSHVRYRVRFITDPDAHFEECNGRRGPLTEEEYKEFEYMKDDGKGGRTTIPYTEYLAYYGNPARHVYLMCLYQVGCTCCGHWEPERHYLGWIDNMDDSPELAHRGKWLTPEYLEMHAATLGYLYTVATEALEEAAKS